MTEPMNPSLSQSSSWKPTISHVRATVGGLLLAMMGALLRRPDLVVLATPLLVVTGWSVWSRPRHDPVVSQRLHHHTVREGEATTWQIDVRTPHRLAGVRSSADVRAGVGSGEDVGAVVDVGSFVEVQPCSGAVASSIDPITGAVELRLGLRATRWGRRPIVPATVAVTSAWASFRWTPPVGPPVTVTTLPLPSAFDATAPGVHALGLVGVDRSARPGDGNEFAGIRLFQPGDRLRRVHWPRSMRTGALHVTATWADHDRHVLLLADAFSDVGDSGGIDGAASSLDTTVRAAGAIAQHHLHRGDRVSLQIIGTRGMSRVPPASGHAQLRRILDRLSAIEVGTQQYDDARLHLPLPAGVLVVMLSPLVSPTALQRAVTIASRGIAVVVVDTLPSGLVAPTEGAAPTQAQSPTEGRAPTHTQSLAWRIRLLERRREVARVQEAGIPVVQWRGPGSLDQVLRDLHRRSRAPRLVRR